MDIRGTAILRNKKLEKGRYRTGAPNSLIFIVAHGTVSQLLLGVHPVVNQVLLICHFTFQMDRGLHNHLCSM